MISRLAMDQLRWSIALSDIVRQHLHLVRRGRYFIGLCPFHNEHTPSFQVDDETGRYRCWGCGVNGDAVDFLSQKSGIGFLDALQIINGGALPDQIDEPRQAEFRARQEARETEREAKRKKNRAEAADRAKSIWSNAKPCATHPYLARKQVHSYGLRSADYRRTIDGVSQVVAYAVFVPMYDAGHSIVSLQAIFPDSDNPLGRDRDFLPNGQKDGAYFPIAGDRTRIAICEGYATGASVRAATGRCVAVAMTAGNLLAVAKIVRERCSDADIAITADNDRWTVVNGVPRNTGMIKGKEAADATGSRLCAPEFSSLDSRPTDFNDLHIIDGLDAVARQIERS